MYTLAAIVAVRARSFRTEVPQDDARFSGFAQAELLPKLAWRDSAPNPRAGRWHLNQLLTRLHRSCSSSFPTIRTRGKVCKREKTEPRRNYNG